MTVRRLPVRPDLDQLHRQAKELLRLVHAVKLADAIWRDDLNTVRGGGR